jgi:hypothetical protein
LFKKWLFSGTHNSPKSQAILRIHGDYDTAYQNEEDIGARFSIAVLCRW